jgi:hypothetical protein
MLLNSFHGLFRGLKLDLAIPTYQKYINTLSHDRGDIKNVENELITKKIQVFEIRRYIYISISFSTIIFAAKLSLQDTTFSAVFLYDRISLSPSRSFMKSRSPSKLFKSIGRLSIGLVTNKLRPHLYTR